MITIDIEAHNKCHVACIDIPGAYLNVITDEEEIMLLRGPLAELMVMVDSKLYCKFVTYDSKGVAHYTLRMKKVLYILLKSDLLL